MAPKIVVIEDREDVVRVLKTYLEPEGFQVVTAATGEEGLRVVNREKPDLLILDLVLPGLDGLEVCRRLRRDPDTAQLPILILSGKGEATDRVTGLEVGADDYVAKPFNATEVVARVKALLRRASGSPAVRMLREGSIEVDIDRYTVSVEGRPVKLTAKEFDLLRALLEAKGRTLTRSFLLETIWGYGQAAAVESRTLDVHILALRKKLGKEGKRILTVRNVGYRVLPADQEPS